MAAGGTSSNVQHGPGRLDVAPVGTAEPTTASAALPFVDDFLSVRDMSSLESLARHLNTLE